MPKTVEFDTFLVTLKAPCDLPEAAVSKIRRILDRPAFQSRLRRSVESLLGRYPALRTVTLSLSR
jgi:hypothetical protein